MSRSPARLLVLSAVLALVALPAAAGDWIVELANGSQLISRYQPREASWDPNIVLLMTSDGNTIGLSRGDIASVRSDIESRGFGTVIDSKTIALGWAPNDLPDPAAEPGTTLSPEMQILQQMIAQQGQQTQGLTVQQFVDPVAAGGGLPSFGASGGAPIGDAGSLAPGGLGTPGIVTAPPTAGLPIPQTGSLPLQGTSLPVQSAPVISP
ncbi:MAG TPA: hypothetical protein VM617_03835 [Thermoanaerobaculia bacterium]|nr:hypothetical protein [Thermoanaerobaculia bacterium]